MGAPIERRPPQARAAAGIGYVPQGRQIFPGLSVRENLHFGAVAKRRDRRPRLRPRRWRSFPNWRVCSTGRAGRYRAASSNCWPWPESLAGAPRLLLLDEPTEGIQPSIVQAMEERIGTLRRSRGLSVLLVEQNLDFIRALADRVLLIHRGRIVREIPHDAIGDPSLDQEFIGAECPVSTAYR